MKKKIKRRREKNRKGKIKTREERKGKVGHKRRAERGRVKEERIKRIEAHNISI